MRSLAGGVEESSFRYFSPSTTQSSERTRRDSACSGHATAILFELVDLESKLKRRRTERVLADIPILVKGNAKGKRPFSEPTRSVVVNAHGALITLVTSVEFGEELILTNVATQEEQQCRVVYLGAKEGGRTEVGIAFKRPAPKFWRIADPPIDWKSFLK